MTSTNFISTEDVSLASAILTMGVAQSQDAINITKRNGKKQYIFFFAKDNGEGEHHYKTNDLIKAWHDDDYVENNPNCYFAYIKQYHLNRNHLLDEIKQGDKMYVETVVKGKIALINPRADEAKIQDLLN
tara:strand:+ start:149 stop:538 length:390 start_codon:yes stop_codon:yes gene_type:complete